MNFHRPTTWHFSIRPDGSAIRIPAKVIVPVLNGEAGLDTLSDKWDTDPGGIRLLSVAVVYDDDGHACVARVRSQPLARNDDVLGEPTHITPDNLLSYARGILEKAKARVTDEAVSGLGNFIFAMSRGSGGVLPCDDLLDFSQAERNEYFLVALSREVMIFDLERGAFGFRPSGASPLVYGDAAIAAVRSHYQVQAA